MSQEMAPNDDSAQAGYIVIGQITGSHGIRGELRITVLTDFPQRYQAGTTVFLGDTKSATPVEITSVRPHKDRLLVMLAGVTDRTSAESLRNRFLVIPAEEAMPLGEGENYVHDLVGLTVETTEGERLGKLTDILFTGANDVYVVRGDAGEILIPALKTVVDQIDLKQGKLVVTLPDGLRD